MAFPDFPFTDEIKSYMTHSNVSKYLEDYTEHFSLRNLIQFNHQVESVTPKSRDNNKDQWEVTDKDLTSNNETTSIFDAVIVCNG